jgi:DNA polymerase-3 subunit epsilon
MKAGVFDTETTGLIDNIGRPLVKQPHVIEYFMVTADTDKMELGDSLSLLIKPPVTITAEITRITGITNEMVANSPYFREIAQQIADQIASHDVLVAHNAAYDRDMIIIEFERLGIDIKLPPLICTVEATEWLQGYRLSLGKLHEKLFGFDFADHHRAEADTRALGNCFLELVKRGWL